MFDRFGLSRVGFFKDWLLSSIVGSFRIEGGREGIFVFLVFFRSWFCEYWGLLG